MVDKPSAFGAGSVSRVSQGAPSHRSSLGTHERPYQERLDDLEGLRSASAEFYANSGDLFNSCRRFVFFTGYARSGHSLVGALLNSHPNALIAHELDAFYLLDQGFTRDELYSLIALQDQEFARHGRKWAGYSYELGDGDEQASEPLRVIGDKKGSQTAQRLGAKPHLLHRLRDTIGEPVTAIHVVRNPYDVISSRCQLFGVSVRRATNYFFRLCEINAEIRGLFHPGELVDMRFEDFVADPGEQLSGLSRALGLRVGVGWLRACKARVLAAPHASRYGQRWSGRAKNRVAREMKNYELLADYSYDSPV